jgi:hypothetical protein
MPELYFSTPRLPPGVVAAVGAGLCATDRAALACASRLFGSAHHAVAEEDAWPSSPRAGAGPAESTDVGVARARVALLVRAMPGLRTLRVGLGQHEEAEAFLVLGGGRAVRFDYLNNLEGRSTSLVRAFPGRVGFDVMYMSMDLCGAVIRADAVELLVQLQSVGCLDIATFRSAAATERQLACIDANARRLVALLPWAAIRSVRIACTSPEETAALLPLVPTPALGLRICARVVGRLGATLAAVRARPDAARALERVARLHLDSEGLWGQDGVDSPFHRVSRAMPAIALLPPTCALSISASLCRHEQVVALLCYALSPDGGRRERVEVACGGGAGIDSFTAFQRRTSTPPALCPFVQAVAAGLCASGPRQTPLRAVDAQGRPLKAQPDGDAAAAIARLRADPATEGVAALWAFSLGATSGSSASAKADVSA